MIQPELGALGLERGHRLVSRLIRGQNAANPCFLVRLVRGQQKAVINNTASGAPLRMLGLWSVPPFLKGGHLQPAEIAAKLFGWRGEANCGGEFRRDQMPISAAAVNNLQQ